jgi:hypothetical protein
MNRVMEIMKNAVKSFTQPRKNGSSQDVGYGGFREDEEGPPLFYTESCPEGTYLIGVIEVGTDAEENRVSEGGQS